MPVHAVSELLHQPGLGQTPEDLRPYLAPLTLSVAAPPGSKLLPSRSGALLEPEEFVGKEVPSEWTPWGVKEVDPHGYRLSSGPQAGSEGRPAFGQGYRQEPQLWKLSGVADGWSRPFAPTPGRQPTAKMAIGHWTPFGSGGHPLPGNPQPSQMIRPSI